MPRQVTLYSTDSRSYRIHYDEDGTKFAFGSDEWIALSHNVNDNKRLFKFELPNGSTLELLARSNNVNFQNAMKKALLDLNCKLGSKVTPNPGIGATATNSSSSKKDNGPELDVSDDDDVENRPQASASSATKKIKVAASVPSPTPSVTSIDKENFLEYERYALEPASVSLIRSLGNLSPVGPGAWDLTIEEINGNTFGANCTTDYMSVSYRFTPVKRYNFILLTDLQPFHHEKKVRVLFHLTKDRPDFTEAFDAHIPFGDEPSELQTPISTDTDQSFIEKVLEEIKTSPADDSKSTPLTKRGQIRDGDFESIDLHRNSSMRNDKVSLGSTRKDSEESHSSSRRKKHFSKIDKADELSLLPSTAYRVLVDVFTNVSSEPRKTISKAIMDIVKSAWFRRELQFGYCMTLAGRETISAVEKRASILMNTLMEKDSNSNQINFEDLTVIHKPFEGREFWRVQPFEDQIMLMDPDLGKATKTWIKPVHFGFVLKVLSLGLPKDNTNILLTRQQHP